MKVFKLDIVAQIFSFTTFSLAYGDRNIDGEFTLGFESLDVVAIFSSSALDEMRSFLIPLSHVDVSSQLPPPCQQLTAEQSCPSLFPLTHLQQSPSIEQVWSGLFEQTGVDDVGSVVGVDEGEWVGLSLVFLLSDWEGLCVTGTEGEVEESNGIVGKTCCETAKADGFVDGTSEGCVLIEDKSDGGEVGKPDGCGDGHWYGSNGVFHLLVRLKVLW